MMVEIELHRDSWRQDIYLFPGHSRKVLYVVKSVPMLVEWRLQGKATRDPVKHEMKLSLNRQYSSHISSWDLRQYEKRGIFIPGMTESLDKSDLVLEVSLFK